MGMLEIFFLIIAGGFLFLVLLAVIVGVGIYLWSRSRKTTTYPVPAAARPPEPAPEVIQPREERVPEPDSPAAARTCAHCGQELKEAWTHCPYCGAPVQFMI